MYSNEEKILILGALFHDIGKFVQRCIDAHGRTHQVCGRDLVTDDRLKDLFAQIVEGEKSFERFQKIILQHHNKNVSDELAQIVQTSDRISASERVEFEKNEDIDKKWSHKYLCSLFSKVNLNSSEKVNARYYKQIYLTKKNYNAMIPAFETEEEAKRQSYGYTKGNLDNFTNDLATVLTFYKNPEDFDSLINLLLVLLEKYLWCVPDFTGSSETDISLFNHLKDVAAISHAIYKSKSEKKELNLIIGDIPGIQSYIFDINNRKAAKMLRGRSIFVQVLSRNFATLFLKKLELTDCNLIMLAGGKFYIVAQSSDDFASKVEKAKTEIEEYLFDNFDMELQFAYGRARFNHPDLRNKTRTFGDIIEEATLDLLNKRNNLFSGQLNLNNLAESNYVLDVRYVEGSDAGDSIKCRISEKPIKEGRKETIHAIDPYDEPLTVDKQIKLEYDIGHGVTDDNHVIEIASDNLTITANYDFGTETTQAEPNKILLNPDLDGLLSEPESKLPLLKNTHFIEAASYVSRYGDGNVMDFEDLSKENEGAKLLTLIKGDIDNLGLLMAYGLSDDANDFTGISRTTTLSNHLKYFFGFFMNGFLKENAKEFYPYTIFAGGDDLMLICPQSRALDLLIKFDNSFSEFTCGNKEIHITYSVTHFKENTPVRIVAAFAEEAQENAKEKAKGKKYNNTDEMLNDPQCFYPKNNKASLNLFNSIIKTENQVFLNEKCNKLVQWGTKKENEEREKVSMGTIRNLLLVSEIIKAYKEDGDTSRLIWHPHLTYHIRRVLKDKDGNYKDPEVGQFFEKVLSIIRFNEESILIEEVLYPAVCGAIYRLRKTQN